MKPAFYIVDDDSGVRRILANIIDEYRLGYVIGENSDGNTAINEIMELKPDIALVDLLLPSMDGIEIVKSLKESRCETQIIMISQVTSKEMIGEAYKNGIEYYINKPINVIEVVSIIKKATENLRLKQALSLISGTLKNNKYSMLLQGEEKKRDVDYVKEEILKIFSDLGILGEAGSNDLLHAIEMVIEERTKLGVKIHKYKVSEIYKKLNERYRKENKPTVSIKAIEQRIRRIIQSALQNLASVGIEDYGSIKFEKYSTSLFDFKEVKREMDYIRKKSKYRGKISVKKFIEGVMTNLEI